MVGEATYSWTLSQSPDTQRLAVRRDGEPGRLEIVFVAGPGQLVPDGLLHAGGVMRGDSYLNLHQPGAIRALLDEALRRGWHPGDPGRTEVDGWSLFDSAVQGGGPRSPEGRRPLR